jgi:hypothetical protein
MISTGKLESLPVSSQRGHHGIYRPPDTDRNFSMRRRLFAVLLSSLALTTLTACVMTRVTGKVVGEKPNQVQRVALVVRDGQFAGKNIAGRLGQTNLESLIPNLQTRLPAVFELNGLPTRLVAPNEAAEQPARVKLSPGEGLIVVTPSAATYSSRSGQTLTVRAELINATSAAVVWRAEIQMSTLGFGKFDAKVANDIAIQMLERLRSDGIAALSEGPLLAAPATPATPATPSTPS